MREAVDRGNDKSSDESCGPHYFVAGGRSL